MSIHWNGLNPPPIFSHGLTQDVSRTKKFHLSVVVRVSLWLNRQSFENFDGGFRPGTAILSLALNERNFKRAR
jgi:hypothetical protein